MSISEISDAKQRVLDVAEQLFMERGYAAITLRDIADELGIRQASLYYHFPGGKEQLYVEVAERVFARHSAGMEAAIDSAGTDLAARLRAISQWFASQPQMNISSMMHADMPALSQEHAVQLSQTAYRCLFEPLRRAFIDGNQQGETRYVNPDILAGTFLAIIDGMAFSGDGPGTPKREEMVEEIISVLLDGIRLRTDSNGMETSGMETSGMETSGMDANRAQNNNGIH